MDVGHVVLASLLALAAAFVFVKIRNEKEEIESAVHKWASDVATYLAKMGFSKTIINPFQLLAAGDEPGALGSGIQLAHYLHDHGNREKEILTAVQTALADPVVGPKVRALAGAIQTGDAKAIQAAYDETYAVGNLKKISDAHDDLHHAVEDIHASALHPEFAGLLASVPGKFRGVIAKALMAGKALGVREHTSENPLAALADVLRPLVAKTVSAKVVNGNTVETTVDASAKTDANAEAAK